MERNVGDLDRNIRIVLGAFSGVLSLTVLAQHNFVSQLPSAATGLTSLPEITSPILGVVSVVLLATAFTEKCGLYSVIGIDTCKVPE